MDSTELKARLRVELRARRDAMVAGLDSAARLFAFHAAPTPLKELIEQAGCIAGYRPQGSEADPAALLDYAAEAGKTIALPYVERRSVPMRFLAWAPGDALVAGQWGLEQPDPASAPEVAPDLFLAPLL
jgi:5-formyltetrahydrofolate cyclo-ligase